MEYEKQVSDHIYVCSCVVSLDDSCYKSQIRFQYACMCICIHIVCVYVVTNLACEEFETF